MKRAITIAAVLFLPISLWAMSLLSDYDLSNVNSQSSLSITTALMKEDKARDYPGRISRFWQNSIYHTTISDIHADEEGTGILDTHAIAEQFSFSFMSWVDKDAYFGLHGLQSDTDALTYLTRDIEDLFLRRFLNIINSVADASDPSYHISDAPEVKMTYSIAYPKGYTGRANENGPNIVDLRPDGHTQLRVYYAGQAEYSIQPNSWVNVRVP